MFPFEYTILVFLLLIYLCNPNKDRMIWIVVGYMIFLGMMRGLEVGTDHMGYETDFYYITDLSSSKFLCHRFETGFVGCIVLFKKFCNDYLTFTALLVPPTVLGLLIFIKKQTNNVAIALALMVFTGLYFRSFNLIRQMLAIALALSFIQLIYDKKYLYFTLILAIISFSFHKSTLILLLLIPFHYIAEHFGQINKLYCYIAIIVSFISFYVGRMFIQDSMLSILSILDMAEYNSYIMDEHEEIGNNISLLLTVFSLITIYVKEKDKNVFQTISFVAYIVLFNFFQMLRTDTGRIALPFLCFYMVLIPNMLNVEKIKYRRLYIILTIAIFIALFVRSYVLANSGEIKPYYFRDF